MQISEIHLYLINMSLKHPFKTSFGTTQDREILLVKVVDEETGNVGWGECIAEHGPFYSSETITSCKHIIVDYIWPRLSKVAIEHPSEFPSLVAHLRGNNMAKACIEDALWALYGENKEQPLSKIIGGKKKVIPSGISIGIQKDIKTLLEKISAAINKNYKRIKIKIEPGWDVQVVKEVRDHFPDIPLMVDANAAYR
ncbi:MAG: enolase C-terminal domain-like protein, partial [Candidatus Heimdallarchaeaceae archaeon]